MAKTKGRRVGRTHPAQMIRMRRITMDVTTPDARALVKASITLTLTLDEDFLSAQAVKRGVLPEVIEREIIADLECRVCDVCKWRDGIAPHGVTSRVELITVQPFGERA